MFFLHYYNVFNIIYENIIIYYELRLICSNFFLACNNHMSLQTANIFSWAIIIFSFEQLYIDEKPKKPFENLCVLIFLSKVV